MSITAMKLALEALNKNLGELRIAGARHILRTAIAEAEKPVAWMNRHGACKTSLFREVEAGAKDEYTIPLYTTPPAAQRQPLTDDEIWKFWWSRPAVDDGDMESQFVAAVRAVLAAHGITGEKP